MLVELDLGDLADLDAVELDFAALAEP